MAVFPGFLGPSYVERSVNVATDRLVNLYAQMGQVDGGKTPTALYNRCGVEAWLDLGGSAVRALFAQNGRRGAVVDGTFYEVFPNQTAIARGSVVNDGRPASISSNGQGGNQWFITSGLRGYIYNLTTNALTLITDASFRPSTMGFFSDGYFGSLIAGSNSFQISDLEDGTNWSTGSAGTGTRSEGSDNLVSCAVDHRYIWTLGEQTTNVYFNSGATFPFSPLPSIFIEIGCGAAFSPTQIDNGLVWLAQSKRGARYAVRADGPTPSPSRISTMGVESIWATYTRVDDAIGWAVEILGHAFWYLYFPTADATWVYDASQPPQLAWHEEGTWDATIGAYRAYPGRCHLFADGDHFVGDYRSGKIGRINESSYADFSTPIRWYRQTAHICGEQVRQIHDRLQVDLEVGVGLNDTSLQGGAPTMWAQWSDDGGHQFKNEHFLSMGALGQWKYRAFLTRLGQTRDRVYRVAGADPVKTALVGAYLNVRPGRS